MCYGELVQLGTRVRELNYFFLIALAVNERAEGSHRLAASRSEVRAAAASGGGSERMELKVKISNMSKKTVAGTIRNAFMQYGELEIVDIILDGNDLPSGSAILLYR